jgi:hypothetical protein
LTVYSESEVDVPVDEKGKEVDYENPIIRKCERLQGRQGKIAHIATAGASQKDLYGNSLTSSNSFPVLADDDISDRDIFLGYEL